MDDKLVFGKGKPLKEFSPSVANMHSITKENGDPVLLEISNIEEMVSISKNIIDQHKNQEMFNCNSDETKS